MLNCLFAQVKYLPAIPVGGWTWIFACSVEHSWLIRRAVHVIGATVAVVTTSDRSAAIMQTLLKTPDKAQWTVELQPGGISVVDVTVDAACTDSQDDTVHCMNNRAHIMDC